MRKETRCCHIGYSFRLTARVLLYAPSHRQDSTYHGLCYTSRGALAGTRNSSMGPPHEGSIRRPIAPWANALTTELHLAPVAQVKWVTPSFSFLMFDMLTSPKFCITNMRLFNILKVLNILQFKVRKTEVPLDQNNFNQFPMLAFSNKII